MFKVNLTRKVEARLCASRDAEGVVKSKLKGNMISVSFACYA